MTSEQREIGDAEHLFERILSGVMPLSSQEGMERVDFQVERVDVSLEPSHWREDRVRASGLVDETEQVGW